MKRKINSLYTLVAILVVTILFAGCSSQKDTFTNRKLQNLSAKYNIIYNSNVILNEYLEGVYQSQKEDYTNFLSLYYAPKVDDVNGATTKIKQLDDIAQKARTLIAEKTLSNYVDDAYILLGKASFYEGKYYNATAFFDYVTKAYAKDHNIYLNALNWKARSYIALNDFENANVILDSVGIELDSVKRKKADPYATLAQTSIILNNNKNAIKYLEKAIKSKPAAYDKIRWQYTLAQLYENEKEFEKSLKAYHKVEKSNSSFEMYFNAKLSKIRINEQLNEKLFDRNLQLSKLLKDEKNIDFKDQIYTELGDEAANSEDFEKAEDYYNLAIRNSTVNNAQKSAAYLRIAELNFKTYNDYVTAKRYYDSTLLFLPKTQNQYKAILAKSQNLSFLKEKIEVIDLQDTLQKIAALPTADRGTALANYLSAKQSAETNAKADNALRNTNRQQAGEKSNSTFYFANATTITKGYAEFTKRWGNRKQTNNWRQSAKTTNQQEENKNVLDVSQPQLFSNPDDPTFTPATTVKNTLINIDSLPITPAQLIVSNQKILNAYVEIGNFYMQVLADKPEAIKVFNTALQRFPQNDKLDVIYYSLYLAYKDIDREKSTFYKNSVLNDFPNTVFAKTIIDPNFSTKKNELDALLNKEYEKVFNQLVENKLKDVISDVDAINKRFPGNKLTNQFSYLKAIAIGKSAPVDDLIKAFKEIIAKDSTDNLIKPLVEDHLKYINSHFISFKKRKVALINHDASEIPFQGVNYSNLRLDEPIIANLQNPTGKKQILLPNQLQLPQNNVVAEKTTVNEQAKAPKDDVFNPASSTRYYFVFAINQPNLSLSSTRFGIGQFNRGNFAGYNLRHQIKEIEKAQLILVGDFQHISDVKRYEQNIKPQLNSIMKVPSQNYSTFAISKENLDKITNRETLERYIRYISSNEL